MQSAIVSQTSLPSRKAAHHRGPQRIHATLGHPQPWDVQPCMQLQHRRSTASASRQAGVSMPRCDPKADPRSTAGQTEGSPITIAAIASDGNSSPQQAVQGSWLSKIASAAAKVCAAVVVVALCQHVLVPAAHAAGAAVATSGSGNPLSGLVSFILHLDKHLSSMIEQHGRATYGILWAIVFAETGLVLTPFLPGDSLLFAAGAFAGMGKLDVGILMVVFLTSAILGDAVNYAVGNKLGGWAVERNLVKQEYIKKTEKFYAKYGGKTVVLARFVPIIRTFAPFVAGVGSMPYSNFATYNVLGAVVWSVLFVGAGFFFGNLPFVQKNFTLVVLAIVAVSVVPVGIELINARREDEEERRRAQGGNGASA